MTADEILTHAKTLNDQERQTFRGQILAAASMIGAPNHRAVARNPNAIRRDTAMPNGPRIGSGYRPLPDVVFTDPGVQTAFKGGPVVWTYVLAAVGLYSLAQVLQLPIMKIGASATGFRDRIDALGRDQYASRWKKRGVLQPESHGHARFEAEHPVMAEARSSYSPVRQAARSIEVRTAGMDGAAFEKALAVELRPYALHVWIKSEEGVAHCRRLDLDPEEFVRFTSYGFGPDRRVSMATELYVGVRPRLDGDRLADICERIVARYMGLI